MTGHLHRSLGQHGIALMISMLSVMFIAKQGPGKC